MRVRAFPIYVEEAGRRLATGLRATATEKSVVIALRLRDRGWDPHRVSFDPKAGAWIS
jgi:hypothetical protein